MSGNYEGQDVQTVPTHLLTMMDAALDRMKQQQVSMQLRIERMEINQKVLIGALHEQLKATGDYRKLV